MGIEIKLERQDAQILGPELQYEGQMEPIGTLMDFLNTASRTTFPLFSVRVMPLREEGPFKGVTRPEITVNRSELGLIYFTDPSYRKKVQVLKSFDAVIAYTPHLILRGRFHRGAEARLRDLFDTIAGSFLAMTQVSIFPKIDLPSSLPKQADLIILNRSFVNFYHAE